MSRILLVEDSRTFGSLIQRKLAGEIDSRVDWAKSLAEARSLLADPSSYFIALLDLNLPDAQHGEVVEAVVKAGIPAVIFTGEIDDNLRDRMWAKGIVDYVVKDSFEALDYVTGMVRRLDRNRHIKALVVDASKPARKRTARLLEVHRYQVLEADSAAATLTLLQSNPDVRLMLVDHHLPDKDGCSLVREVRRTHPKGSLAVIGLSAEGRHNPSARFIKSGANDYLHKNFIIEEFYCRVNQNMENLELLDQVRELANRDPLTRAYNRRFFYEAAAAAYAQALGQGSPLAAAMLDIDHFKRINDTHGHASGDKALVALSAMLSARFGSPDLVARYGGEEFVMLCPNLAEADAARVFEAVRDEASAIRIETPKGPVGFTVSIGVACSPADGLEAMLRQADANLYAAKAAGRDRVVVGPGGAELGQDANGSSPDSTALRRGGHLSARAWTLSRYGREKSR